MCNYLPLREAKFVFQGFSNKLHYIGVLVSLPYICNVMEGNILFYFYLCIYFRKYFAEIITCNTVVLSVQHNFFFKGHFFLYFKIIYCYCCKHMLS